MSTPTLTLLAYRRRRLGDAIGMKTPAHCCKWYSWATSIIFPIQNDLILQVDQVSALPETLEADFTIDLSLISKQSHCPSSMSPLKDF